MKKRATHFSNEFGLARKTAVAAAFALLISCCASIGVRAQEKPAGKDWPKAAPKEFGIDPDKLAAIDADLASGKYGLVDSMLVLRCGTAVYDKSYAHDYGKIYGERAKKEGPLNHDPQGPYNYFSTDFHPYYRGSDMHTMQSISKTVTSVAFGIARTRDDFTAGLDTPIMQYFNGHKIANLDARKKRITIRDLLTMTAGIEWHEDLPYDDPKNSADIMEASHDWAEYAIDQPMADEPGKTFVYNSGASELLAHIFKKVTGKNVDDYTDEHLFKPLGMHYYWKHSPTGLPDTEGGLYLSSHDLAKIGQLYLKGGMSEGKELVSSSWIKESVAPHVAVPGGDWKYGYQWWLQSFGSTPDDVAWTARGFGGQLMFVLPEYDMVAVFTGWDILPSSEKRPHDLLPRLLDAANRFYGCVE
ncbi:MAG: serine hydrolase [Candidatus Acidiferrum sp.]|jgi:CubicO group peptidase (beta-lactamase class C family)